MKRLKHYWSRFMNNKDRVKAGVMIGLVSSPSVVFAQDLQGVIDNTVMYLQGGTARAVGILCIVITGYLCLARQVFPKESFMMVLVGMGLIFGSTSLYSTLIGM